MQARSCLYAKKPGLAHYFPDFTILQINNEKVIYNA